MDPRAAALRRVVEQVAAARDSSRALDIRGGHTKDFYGGVSRGEILDLSPLAGILSYEPTELVVTALAGTSLAELEAVLASRGQCLPFEPPRFGAAGTVGGMVAAGLAGPARACVGALRDYLLGVSVVNGRGERLTFGGQVMKNVAGYDIARVFAGSMGVLGVIYEVSLRVMPVNAACVTLVFDSDQAGALGWLSRWAGSPLPLSASAWRSERLYVRLGGARAAVESARQRLGGTVLEARGASDWWQSLRDHGHEFFKLASADLVRGECLWRMSVPDNTPPIALPGEQLLEWGGAQRWLRSMAPAVDIRAAVAARGGHATLVRAADKSAGVFTRPAPPLMAIHQRLKQSFDPVGIFNPGRLYAEF